MKRDRSVPIGLTVMGLVVGAVLIPAGIGSANAHAPDAVPAPVSTAFSGCETFDEMIRDATAVDPKATYEVLDRDGAITETTEGHPGPQAQARIAANVAYLQQAKEQAITRGDSCIGSPQP
jgi:hypothetical protein